MSCPSCVCSIKQKSKKDIKCRLVQYGKKRRVRINQCAPLLKCDKDSCRSFAGCTPSRVNCCSRPVCVHKPKFACRKNGRPKKCKCKTNKKCQKC